MEKCTSSVHNSMVTIESIRDGNRGRLHEASVMHAALDQYQNIIHQAGALSRYFWPSRKSHKERGDFLRIQLRIDDHDPLNDRSLRNAIEHFDERLDNFISDKSAGEFVPDYFGPKVDDNHGCRYFLRSYFVDTDEFTVLGEKFAVHPIVESVVNVAEALSDALRKP